MKTKKQILEERQLLNEDFVENVLMGLGFIPVIGELFDFILMIRYLIKGEYLYAGLMLIALIPTVGDVIAKPIIRLLKGVKGVKGLRVAADLKNVNRVVLNNSDDMYKAAKSNDVLREKYIKIGEHLEDPRIPKLISQVKNIPKYGKGWGQKMEMAIKENVDAVTKVKSLPKTIGQEINAGGKFSTGVKKFFQEKSLARYVAKKGMEPSNWVSRWYNVTYKGRMSRKNLIRNFIMANNLLKLFGLPSLSAFENKMENDENFRNQMANNPNFSNMVNQTTTPQDIESIEGSGESESKRSGIGDKMSLAFIKMLARGIA